MAKKNWIFIKRGLSEDPKHRESMGMAVWLFMHICDVADWETGIVYDWRDKDEANDMSLNHRTVRDWRQQLQAAGYITCQQELHRTKIIIHNWTNPRDYSGKRMNETHGEIPAPEHGDTHGDTHGGSESVTPTYSSSSSPSSSSPEKTFSDPVTAEIDFARSKSPELQLSLAIESALQVKLGLSATGTKGGIEFINFAVKQAKHGEDFQRFIGWWLENYPDRKFWSFGKMRENWPAAFSDTTARIAVDEKGNFYA